MNPAFQILQIVASLFGPIFAAGVVWLGWKRTHTDASSRDLESWRRTTLANAVTEMVAEGEALLLSTFNREDPDDAKNILLSVRKLENYKRLVNACDSGQIWEWTNSYVKNTRRIAQSHKNDFESKIEYTQKITQLLDENDEYRGGLLHQLPISIKLKPVPPFDPNRAYSGHMVRLPERVIKYRKFKRILRNAKLPKDERQPWKAVTDEHEIKLNL